MDFDVMLANIAAFTMQVAFIAAAASVLMAVLRVGPAGVRYTCWRIILLICLAWPWLLQATPEPRSIEQSVPAPTAAATAEMFGISGVSATLAPSQLPAIPWESVVLTLLAAGMVLRAAWLTIGLVRLRMMRRRGEPVDDEECAGIQRALGTNASIRSVPGLTQPATCGIWKTVVLLPETLRLAPAERRRAVITHELFHVQRHDWLWVLGEEALRTVFWFHPAIFWITSRIQLAREELVDELTVLATGDRKAYIEALLAFADAGRIRPAAAFARRPHLFIRIVRLSKESVMSSPRIVVSASFALVAVVGAAWGASRAFPVVSAATPLPAPSAVLISQEPARAVVDPRDAEFRQYLAETQAALRTLAEQGARTGGAPRPGPAPVVAVPPGTKPITPENPIPRRLSSVAVPYPAQLRGTGLRAVGMFRVTLDASGSVSGVERMALARVGTGAGLTADATSAFTAAAVDAIRQWRYAPPADPPIAFYVNVNFDEEGRDALAMQSEAPVAVGRPDWAVPVAGTPVGVGVAIAGQESDAERARTLESAARELQERANAMRRAAAERAAAPEAPRPVVQATAPTQPIRIGGNVRPPTRTRYVEAEYPEIAKSARVQGVVILEVIIDEQGRVTDARVLRSIPLLDQAALDAVRQWEYTPILLNGAPVAVRMTVTVNFTLPERGQ